MSAKAERLGGTSRRRLAVAAAVCAVAALAAVGAYAARDTSSPPAGAAPAPPAGWRADVPSLRALVVDHLGPTSDVPRYRASDGLPRVRAAECSGRSCTVSYNADYTPQSHTLTRMLADQRTILAWAFTDDGLRTLVLTAWGPSQSTATGAIGQQPLFQLTCTRTDVRGVDLATVRPDALRSTCAFEPYVTER
jgi:hypothetical protein